MMKIEASPEVPMKIKLRNRLEVLMKDSGVSSFEEMAQRLTQNQGCKITRTAISRKFRDQDVSFSLSMIEAICNELQCLPGDIFETEISDATESFVEELRTRLQPFRYGTIRLQKPGAASPDSSPASASATTDAPGPTAKKARPAVDLDALVGPRVSHLHAGKLKK
jgi:DNA-binding Xre family transcriptional regulator